MRILDIHPSPRRAIVVAKQIFDQFPDIGKVYLGGGTALEARWHHRDSTDLDFFASGPGIDTLFYQNANKIREVFDQFAQKGVLTQDVLRFNNVTVLHFEILGTPVSLGRVREFHGMEGNQDVERQTGIELSSATDILTKKLHSRGAINSVWVERDAYDFAVAMSIDPDAMVYAWSHLNQNQRDNIKVDFADHAENPPSEATGRKVRNARYADLAEKVWVETFRMFDSDLSYAPDLNEGDNRGNIIQP